jgi:nucleotide-binding universal stress UspA family protein
MTVTAPAAIAFERILVPTDFSDVSERALEYAKSIALAHRSEIALVHAYQPVNPVTPPEVVWFDQFTEQEPAEQRLHAETALLSAQGFRARAISVAGDLREEILSAAETHKSGLIVLGTHARTGLSRLFFGSEAESLFRRAHCPILVVGPATRPVEAEPWQPREILCACDFDPDSTPTAAFASRLADEFGANLTVVHIDDSRGHEQKEVHQLRFEFALAPLLAGTKRPELLWRVLMIGYTVGATIADLAIERKADLVVMGAHGGSPAQTHMPPGVAPQVLAKAPCPVMIVPRQ